jgi:hypothetical protein
VEVDPNRVLPQTPLEVKEDLTLEVKQVKILDFSKKDLRNKVVPIMKVL